MNFAEGTVFANSYGVPFGAIDLYSGHNISNIKIYNMKKWNIPNYPNSKCTYLETLNNER